MNSFPYIDRPKLAILIDPDKTGLHSYAELLKLLSFHSPDVILVGGSSEISEDIGIIVEEIRSHSTAPIYLFPAGRDQLCDSADGLLLSTLISGRNAEFLIGKHVDAAHQIKSLNIPVLPIGYMLVGNYDSSASRLTFTTPIPDDDMKLIVNTALAGQLLGLGAIYMEAGSGALQPISNKTIRLVKETINCPLFVGGGIRNTEQLQEVLSSGADLAVVGTALEQNPHLLPSMIDLVSQYCAV